MTAPGKPLDLDGMEAVARAATQGEWRITGSYDGGVEAVIPGNYHGYPVCYVREPQDGVSTPKTNAAHIATFDPPTVLALIQTQRELVGALEAVDGEVRMTASLQAIVDAALTKALGEQPL